MISLLIISSFLLLLILVALLLAIAFSSNSTFHPLGRINQDLQKIKDQILHEEERELNL